MTNGTLIKEALAIIYCSNERRFKEIFGAGEDQGVHLWKKFRELHEGDVGKFVCDLDGNNSKLLGDYTLSQLGKQKSLDGTAYHATRVGELIDNVIAREKLCEESVADLGFVRLYMNETQKKANDGFNPGHILGFGDEG